MNGDRVIYDGEVWIVTGEALAQTIGNDGQEIVMPVLRLQKLESALQHWGIVELWVNMFVTYTLTSSLDYRMSEWMQGIRSYLQRGYKGNRSSDTL